MRGLEDKIENKQGKRLQAFKVLRGMYVNR